MLEATQPLPEGAGAAVHDYATALTEEKLTADDMIGETPSFQALEKKRRAAFYQLLGQYTERLPDILDLGVHGTRFDPPNLSRKAERDHYHRYFLPRKHAFYEIGPYPNGDPDWMEKFDPRLIPKTSEFVGLDHITTSPLPEGYKLIPVGERTDYGELKYDDMDDIAQWGIGDAIGDSDEAWDDPENRAMYDAFTHEFPHNINSPKMEEWRQARKAAKEEAAEMIRERFQEIRTDALKRFARSLLQYSLVPSLRLQYRYRDQYEDNEFYFLGGEDVLYLVPNKSVQEKGIIRSREVIRPDFDSATPASDDVWALYEHDIGSHLMKGLPENMVREIERIRYAAKKQLTYAYP